MPPERTRRPPLDGPGFPGTGNPHRTPMERQVAEIHPAETRLVPDDRHDRPRARPPVVAAPGIGMGIHDATRQPLSPVLAVAPLAPRPRRRRSAESGPLHGDTPLFRLVRPERPGTPRA